MSELTLNIDDDLREKAFNIIKECGFTPNQIIKLFLQEIVFLKTIPMVIKSTTNQKEADFSKFFGAMDFEGDPLEIQKELRSEWGD